MNSQNFPFKHHFIHHKWHKLYSIPGNSTCGTLHNPPKKNPSMRACAWTWMLSWSTNTGQLSLCVNAFDLKKGFKSISEQLWEHIHVFFNVLTPLSLFSMLVLLFCEIIWNATIRIFFPSHSCPLRLLITTFLLLYDQHSY